MGLDHGPRSFSGWTTDIIAVSSRRYHTIGLRADGSVVATGETKSGKCDVQDWNLLK